MTYDDAVTTDVVSFLRALNVVDLSQFRVVGAYARYDESIRNALQDARQKILAGFEPPGRKRENHLIWAAPGTGKTFFVQQIAQSLANGIAYRELNLAKDGEVDFRAGLDALDGKLPCLCLVDEIDAKPQEPWPYEVLLPYLDAAVDRGSRFVFVLAGSSGHTMADLKQGIAARPKGADLLSRIPSAHEHEIPPMSFGDRLLVALSQMRQAGLDAGREIRSVEKLSLYYVALHPRMANARQLREFAVRAVERVPKSDDRIKYDHLFTPGDSESHRFWVKASPVAEELVNTFVTVVGEQGRSASGAAITAVRESAEDAARAAASESGSRAVVAPVRTNLPRELTSFIGREREIADVKRILPTTALVTLTGFAGVGKTRLALRIAAEVVAEYRHGAWLAELAALSDPALVTKGVATALDVPEQPGRTLTESLIAYLRSKSMLLVLDNCEHVISACAELADAVLRACPNVRILTTSREPLGIPGEAIWRVPALSIPSPTRLPPLEALTQYDAVSLFADRAALSHPGFRVTGGNAAAVAQVAARLEGIPLAIELAAARVKALPVDVIAAKLDDRFRLLTGGARTGPRHQQTLRTALDWSYDLLSEPERRLLRRLSVFAGGFTVEAVEHVCGPNGEDDILDQLTSLVDKSLVGFNERAEPARYGLLESVRQYGNEKLHGAGETAELRRRHRDWCLELVAQAESAFRGPDEATWLDRLETEHDNCRTALEWSVQEPGGAAATLRLTGSLYWFWFIRGHWHEGRMWCERALARSGDASPAALPATIVGAMSFAVRQSDYGRAAELGDWGLAVSRGVNDKFNTALLTHWLGTLALGHGDYERGAAFHKDTLSMGRDLGDKWLAGMELVQLGIIARYQGDYDHAMALLTESLAFGKDTRNVYFIAYNLSHLGAVALLQNDYARAGDYLIECLELSHGHHFQWVTAGGLDRLAGVASGRGEDERAARLFGAAEAARELMGERVSAQEQTIRDQRIASSRERLGHTAFDEQRTRGRAMSLDQAVGYALGADRGDRRLPS